MIVLVIGSMMSYITVVGKKNAVANESGSGSK